MVSMEVGGLLNIGKAEDFYGDLNSLVLNVGDVKIYRLKNGCTNFPTSANSSNGSFLIVFSYDGYCVEQIFIQCTSNRFFKRFKMAEWSEWKEC